ncbi:LytTR family transcriptional regulator DNA-binding domain-containing protein [Saccharopolyspora hattusasensis]|uniref:LytTR family transcriptional regulator DNA-binding domain-containing protein n=1 Tax=Saccharopolyspora hattusasensis TaxID=1128679 RepID=UPI003D98810B
MSSRTCRPSLNPTTRSVDSATDGIDKLDDQFSGLGFMRVHRSYLVNLSRVREVERRDGGIRAHR